MDELLQMLETQVRDLSFMAEQGYIDYGPIRNNATKGQLLASFRGALALIERMKEIRTEERKLT
jgi:hypothetical protein